MKPKDSSLMKLRKILAPQLVFSLLLTTLLLASPASALEVTFSWTKNQEQVDGYRIYYKVDTQGGPEYNGTGTSGGDSPIDVGDVASYTLSGLQENVQYYFAITAYAGTSESSYSDEIVVWTGDLLPPKIEAIIEAQ
jgi:hypothetical protein